MLQPVVPFDGERTSQNTQIPPFLDQRGADPPTMPEPVETESDLIILGRYQTENRLFSTAPAVKITEPK